MSTPQTQPKTRGKKEEQSKECRESRRDTAGKIPHKNERIARESLEGTDALSVARRSWLEERKLVISERRHPTKKPFLFMFCFVQKMVLLFKKSLTVNSAEGFYSSQLVWCPNEAQHPKIHQLLSHPRVII